MHLPRMECPMTRVEERERIPRVRRREAKTAAILDAASELFARDGYENTSLADVARTVDLTPKALYYYYDSKRDLLNQVIDRGFRYFDANALAATRKKWIGLQLEDAVLECALEAAEHLAGRADLLRVSFSESFRGNPETGATHNRYMINWVNHVESVISNTKNPKAIKAARVRASATALVDVIFGLCVDGVLRRRRELVSASGEVALDRKFFRKLTGALLKIDAS
jgi:AcrR family transcriptional regulator